MKVEMRPIEAIKPYEKNPRKNDGAVGAVAKSLTEFGWRQPVVVDSDGVIVVGHTRWRAAKELGMMKIPVHVATELTPEQAKAYRIADNQTATIADWDMELLPLELAELKELGLDLDLLGFDEDQLKEMFAPSPTKGNTDPDDLPPTPTVAVAQPGDIWLLGEHRLLCGNSTVAADVARIMAGDRAALCATDPPYLVDYTGERPNDSGKDWSGVYHEVEIKDAEGFFTALFTNVVGILEPRAALYCWHAHRRCGLIQQVWERLGILDHQQVIWVKPTPVFGRVYWHFRHEPCMMGWVQGSQPEHDSDHELNSVWEIDWEGKSRIVGNEHPCLHSDALVLTEAGYRPIQSIQIGDRVYASDGAFHDVEHVSSHPYTSPELIRITAKGGNVSTLASDNHPFLVWRPERQGRKILGGNVIWARADELRVGDYTMTPALAEPELDPMPERDAEYWFFFGLYLAQGSLQKAGHGENRYPSFAVHKKRQDIVRRIRDHWGSVGEYDSSEYRSTASQGLTVMAFDAGAGEEFERFGGRGARSKRLAPLVLSLPSEKRRAVLDGWLNGDGCKVHNRDYWQGKTVSPDLAAHLALLGESLGYTVNVFRYDPPAELPMIEGRQVKSASVEHHLYFYERDLTDRRSNRISHIEHEGNAYAVRYIKRVERVPYTGDVWNLSVAGCPTFQTAVGMSHNTQKPVEIFARPMRKHTRPGDVVFEPFSGSGSQIIAAEQEGRRCRAIELEPVFVDVAVARWEKFTGKKAERLAV